MDYNTQPITPHLVVNDAAAALDFYTKALGATETMRMAGEDGKRLIHSEITINGARLFVRDHFPEFMAEGCGTDANQPPTMSGSTSVTIHLEVQDCDAAMARAAAAGAKVLMPAEDAFWGARYGLVIDPFGHTWSFAHPLPGAAG